MAVTADKPAPYAPSSALVDLIDRHRTRGLPTPINSDVLARVGISDSLIPRTLYALHVLDLVDADTGLPTKTFEAIRLAPEAEFKDRQQEWLKSAYADIFAVADPGKDDDVRIRDAFRGFQPVGQQNRMVSLFQGLCRAAGLMPETTSSAPKAARPVQLRGALTARSSARGTLKTQPKQTQKTSHGLPPALAGLMDSLPDASEGWAVAERDKFIATFKAVLDYVIPVVKEGEKKSADSDETA